MSDEQRPRLVGINHVALEVSDLEQALRFYQKIFSFELRGRHSDESNGQSMAFIDMGDQFLALCQSHIQATDNQKHIGLVVDDRASVCQRAEAAGGRLVGNARQDFIDPWGNRIQVVEYRDVQFTKTREVLDMLGVSGDKSDAAKRELKESHDG